MDSRELIGLALRINKSKVFYWLWLGRPTEQSIAFQNLKTNYQVFLAGDSWLSKSVPPPSTPPSSSRGMDSHLMGEINSEGMAEFKVESKEFRRLLVPLKLLTLSLYIIEGLPLLAMNRLSACIKTSVERFVTSSKCTALYTTLVKSTIHTLALCFW